MDEFNIGYLFNPTHLQGGESKYRKAWAQICEISRNEFDKVYKRLGVQLEEKVNY